MQPLKHFFHHMPHGDHADGGIGHSRHGLRGERGGRGGRFFSHGSLRFLLLQLISDQPSHGYELIKLIEDRLGGRYSPSPGTVYPTLTLLEEQGYLQQQQVDEGGRKRYAITDSGITLLADNRSTVDAMLARMQSEDGGRHTEHPPQVKRAIENLKLAIRMRLAGDTLSAEQAQAFAALLDHTAQQVEQIK